MAVIIVNYNGGDHLRRCLASLATQTWRPDRLIVVDNASQIYPITGQEGWLSGAELIRASTNLGFAAANNVAVQHCRDVDWVALLNPDAYPEPDWLANLMQAAIHHPTVASFSCRQVNASQPELLDGAGDGLTRGGRPFRRGFGLRGERAYLVEDEPFSASGAGALFRRDAYLSVGGMDEDFFCYLEDVDLGYRLRLSGQTCIYVPQAVIFHEGSAISGFRSDFSTYHGHRNLVWLYLKNTPALLLWIYLPAHLLLTIVAFFTCLRRGQAIVFLRAKRDALRSLPSMLRKRRLILGSQTFQRTNIKPALSSDLQVLNEALKRFFIKLN